jgi:nitrite reductase/ring-hydroxylating ferredoxin subunit
MSEPKDDMTKTSRRAVLAGAGAAGVAVTLSACGGGDSPSATPTTGDTSGIKTSEVPVGGAKIFPGQSVVVTQLTAGTFEVYTAICTHAGCKVDQIAGDTIKCPCHQSTFSIKDGTATGGPAKEATKPDLAKKPFKLSDDKSTISLT